jgi:3',5'-cyclic AMP phosphodiesterase CpdA
MLIAQISDCHVMKRGSLAYGRVDTPLFLERAMDAIAALPRRPDVLLATGDLVDGGTEAEYALFREITARLKLPLWPVAGNHDRRGALVRAFAIEQMTQPGFVQYQTHIGDLRLIVIDTVTPGSPDPSICQVRLDWVAARLSEYNGPTLIAMHHPPFPTGIVWTEPKLGDWARPLEKIVTGRSNIVRVVCGHVHRPTTRLWAGTIAMTAASTAHQVYPDFTPHPKRQFSFEAPGFLMHEWSDGAFASYGVAIPGLNDVFEF